MSSESTVHSSLIPIPNSMDQSQSRYLAPYWFYPTFFRGLGSPLSGFHYDVDWFAPYSDSTVNEEFVEFARYLAAMNAFYRQAAFAAGRAQARRYWQTHLAPRQAARHWRIRRQPAILVAFLIALVVMHARS